MSVHSLENVHIGESRVDLLQRHLGDVNGGGVFDGFDLVKQSFVVDEAERDFEVRRKVQNMLIVEFRVSMAPPEARNYSFFEEGADNQCLAAGENV